MNQSFRYAHLADLHLGAWREEKMRDLSTKAFLTAMDNCMNQKVDFILFAGDLFNTSLPALDTLKVITKKIKELKDQNIPFYVIAGSHDFSPTGKTMIDVLENAGLLKNVCKGAINPETKELRLHFTTDPKTNAKIAGMLGRKGMLDKTYYENLDLKNIEEEEGYKIFLFHTAITELMPHHLTIMEAQPLSIFPKKCHYYAGGHIHHPTLIEHQDYPIVTYPGALFPNNFQEFEQYGGGGYYLITVENEKQTVDWIPLSLIKHQSLLIDCNQKSAEIITFEILNHFETQNVQSTLITLRLKGTMHGRVSDINFKQIFEHLYQKGTYFIMKNTTKLLPPEFEEIKNPTTPEIAEEQMIKEHLQQMDVFTKEEEFQITKTLLTSLNTAKKEGETTTDFQERIVDGVKKIFLQQE